VASCKEQLTKDPRGLRTSIQRIFATYLQPGLGRKNILRFLSTAYEGRVWPNRQATRIPPISHFLVSSVKTKHSTGNSVLLSGQAVVRNS